MTLRWGHAVLVLVALLMALVALAGCGGDDDDEETEQREARPVEGTFVGTAKPGGAFVAVVAAPAMEGQRKRQTTVYLCDAKAVCEWMRGSAEGNRLRAAAGNRAKATVTVTRKAARGSVQLGDGETVSFVARRAAATAGLYSLTVSARGRIMGASATGVGLTGNSTLPEPGPGTLKLADGSRLKFDATRNSREGTIRHPAGQARVIVLPGRRLRGAGQSRGEGGAFFMRSPSG